MMNYGVPMSVLGRYREAVAAVSVLGRYREAVAAVEAIKREISEIALENIGLKAGDIVEEQNSGLHYEVQQCSSWVDFSNTIQISVQGKRLWRSGRKAGKTAYSATHLSFGSLVKISPADRPDS